VGQEWLLSEVVGRQPRHKPWVRRPEKQPETPDFGVQKRGSPGPPGRGVLRFSGQAYRNPVHIFVFFGFFSKNGAI